MVAGSERETSDLGISPSLLFYVVGFALAFEIVLVGLLGLAA